MSNKKGSKQHSNVQLGIPDGEIEVDNDAYASKIGGTPLWLDPNTPPSSDYCTCRVCRDKMYLLFQSYAPLPDSAFHRVVYVWACNKRSCMKKEGSFSVVRSHVVDEVYLKAQRQKEEEKRKKEEKRKAAAANQGAFSQGFQLGDLWGSSAGSFAKAAAKSAAPAKPFELKSTSPFGMKASNETPSFSAKKEAIDIADQMNQLSIQPSPPVDAASLPKFPGQYLYIDDEPKEPRFNPIDMNRYKEFLDMEKEMLMDVDGETWQGETYEKQQLPKGFDKQFKKFTERVELEPSQCVRYEFAGQPLFYSALHPQQQQQITSSCKYCKGPKVFEFQLMPNVLSILPTAEYASESEQSADNTKKSALDRWSVGMEFGTILAFVCQKDCHPGSIEEPAYVEETVLVQFETD
ncbi:hypothetical protein G6F46_009903 [Rhizopus delemar]|uniref:Programmed cell death protein 2 C-terminal domain-containing protein n=1 Tax=Rhizopus oryzae TaxID=64495 RepID=A0A9P7C6G2_RHIOR|nr:hypothetical protein G6F55_008068 [Rhizopus delemar]KAG1538042.1 hypothetical protein G6F51_010008 [Rhizopus arrhizus]KAG1506439.1 hypothetical protein G6F53_009682 [Rhizopus delemar]KAG1521594.1 hypothetical protein G6F52_006603 [Rhizopus delemar]KAG1557244.1 hypothetical protein G6F49_005576 [Rhizopus delemar]